MSCNNCDEVPTRIDAGTIGIRNAKKGGTNPRSEAWEIGSLLGLEKGGEKHGWTWMQMQFITTKRHGTHDMATFACGADFTEQEILSKTELYRCLDKVGPSHVDPSAST